MPYYRLGCVALGSLAAGFIGRVSTVELAHRPVAVPEADDVKLVGGKGGERVALRGVSAGITVHHADPDAFDR